MGVQYRQARRRLTNDAGPAGPAPHSWPRAAQPAAGLPAASAVASSRMAPALLEMVHTQAAQVHQMCLLVQCPAPQGDAAWWPTPQRVLRLPLAVGCAWLDWQHRVWPTPQCLQADALAAGRLWMLHLLRRCHHASNSHAASVSGAQPPARLRCATQHCPVTGACLHLAGSWRRRCGGAAHRSCWSRTTAGRAGRPCRRAAPVPEAVPAAAGYLSKEACGSF
jgi:hypothetical protein